MNPSACVALRCFLASLVSNASGAGRSVCHFAWLLVASALEGIVRPWYWIGAAARLKHWLRMNDNRSVWFWVPFSPLLPMNHCI
ncbi:hypothetical protein CMEL01_11651 [Colletotrichum melonis]|uniref:Secreted protein n=1 Tax=Colletotrichum melonis TaxID=1209925 RepID=A0AAI9UVQ3_9PEZI|nr:hypothetical protein CMEL01_11651 [Colletotrichum melonis]